MGEFVGEGEGLVDGLLRYLHLVLGFAQVVAGAGKCGGGALGGFVQGGQERAVRGGGRFALDVDVAGARDGLAINEDGPD